ncbi:hypothetical protein PN36_14530 [Candidatus Thiomargarita nelsonii]|uniref:UspA domain-containing protein n=1 Tax=Candidatus Thiomargarita nelsonii TaxID=1003181 RepID=A0A4E0QP13_9GAMM|nr:hypothetical protein PN36_14530 [Candidatus Thiomargarita nelsonii]
MKNTLECTNSFGELAVNFKESKYVLLVCREGHVQEKTLHYALNVCKRIGAGLDILCVSHSREVALQEMLTNVPHKLIVVKGAEALVDYVKTHTAVTCAVISHADSLDIVGKWSAADCPLVVVL